MMRVFLGCDVVDLQDTARDARVQARFDSRVFAPSELARLDAAPDPEAAIRERWRLWAAKEAAYKAALKKLGELEFVKSAFVVSASGSSRGRVEHERFTAEVVWDEGPGWVQALAAIGPRASLSLARAARGVLETGSLSPAEESRAARLLASELQARAGSESRGGWEVSLSHDGRFVAAAAVEATTPGEEA